MTPCKCLLSGHGGPGGEELGRCEEEEAEEEERLQRSCGCDVGQRDIPRGQPSGAGTVRALLEWQTWEPDQPWGKPG